MENLHLPEVVLITISPPHPQVAHTLSQNSGSKIFRKSKESFKKQNLDLPWASSYLHSVYIVLGIISNLKIIQSIWEDLRRLYANTSPFYKMDLSIHGFWYPWGCMGGGVGPGTNPPRIPREHCILGNSVANLSLMLNPNLCLKMDSQK